VEATRAALLAGAACGNDAKADVIPRRDWLLPVTLEIADGAIAAPSGPGLGVVPDFDALERYRIG